ncbi:MAG: type II toxin-antitoxin system VapC family toxin [Cyanobacteriota bacterium]|jgi:PIN domain nuclease of toxin-antitoxin system
MILLDTHVWLWLLHNPSYLSPTAQVLITKAEAENKIVVSTISVWEIALKCGLNKLELPLPINEWLELAQRQPGIVIEPLSPLDAVGSTQLPGDFHKDPADRIIVAMARRYDITLITCDNKILNYPHVKARW